MKKTEFLKELEAALKGEVSPELTAENLRYYDNYISQIGRASCRERV